jgi:hypothetical protein
MGRPPIGKHAMSGAERQRRYLDRLLAGKASVTKPTGPVDELIEAVTDMSNFVDTHVDAGLSPLDDVSLSNANLKKLRKLLRRAQRFAASVKAKRTPR